MSDVPPFQPAIPPTPPTYGQQPVPGQQPAYGQQPAAGYGAPSGWGRPAPAEPRPRTLGLTAMILSLALIVLSVLASAIVGITFGQFTTRASSGVSFNTNDLSSSEAAAVAPAGLLMGVQMLLGTLLGILALVLGIVAVATKRGRPFGVVAIVVSVLAPVLSFAVYLVALFATGAAA